MAHCMGHIMRKKRQAENEKMNEDLRNDREALDAEMETRYFEMAPGPAIGSVMADPAVVDLVMGRLQSEGGFSVGLIDELRKTLDTVPVRFWVVDNSGSMLAKDLIKGTDITKGLQKKKESRWEEMKLMLSFLADFVEALGFRKDEAIPAPAALKQMDRQELLQLVSQHAKDENLVVIISLDFSCTFGNFKCS